ncbi:MAG TPA: PEGA domain-containing protein [Candidatus Saccharimonadales bacterium]|nr:PEGA domain-containing protein [Candidatus Saccharimonadales bacterium]
MPISTIGSENKLNISKIIMIVLGLLIVGLAAYFGKGVIQGLGNLGGRSGLSVTVRNGDAEVYLNNNLAGKTPLEIQTVKPGDNKVTIKNGTKRYETSFTFIPNWHVVVIRDLGTSDVFSSGQNTWVEKTDGGSMLSVISDPAGASVFIDNTEIGKTPYSSDKLTEGEYDLRIVMPGYEEEDGRIKIAKGYKLNIAAKLFPVPAKTRVELMEGSTNLYNVISDNPLVYSDAQSWVNAVLYWNQTRGIDLGGTGVNKDKVFDFLLDYNGVVYNKDGAAVLDATQYTQFKDAKKGAYLGRSTDGPGLTDPAKKTLAALGAAGGTGQTATIGTTPTGWLRVRSAASIDGTELAKVNTGDSFAILEKQTGWVKIKVSDSISGWVSADYVTIK